MRKYKFYNTKHWNVIFTKWLDILDLDIWELWRVMIQNEKIYKWLWYIMFYWTTEQKFKAVNSFPEILESFINTYKNGERK